MNLGEAIKREREKLDWTQEELADKLKVSVMTVKNWEVGRHTPKNALGRIEHVLGIELRDVPTQGPPITTATDAALVGELLTRLHDRNDRIAKLERELDDLRTGRGHDVNTDRWAARPRLRPVDNPPGGGDQPDDAPD